MIQRKRAAHTPNASTTSPPSITPQNADYQPLRKSPSPGRPPAFTPRVNHVHTASNASNGSYFGAGMGGSGLGGLVTDGFGSGGLGGSGGYSQMQMGGTTGLGRYVDEHETGPLARRLAKHVRAGLKDMTELNRSWSLVWGDPELRKRVLKVTLINLMSLLLLSLFPLMSLQTRGQTAARVGFWYNVLLNWPMFATCFAVNAYWGPEVAMRAQALMHPAYRNGTSDNLDQTQPPSTAMLTITRLLLIADFTLVTRSVALVPFLGRSIALAYMCLINSYYAYEWIFANRAWPLAQRCAYISERAAYMFGYGLVPTLLTSFFPPLINMAIFSLLYPFLLIQALQSRPPSADSELSGESSTPLTYVKVPIFVLAQNALLGVQWLLDAVQRERGGTLRDRTVLKGY